MIDVKQQVKSLKIVVEAYKKDIRENNKITTVVRAKKIILFFLLVGKSCFLEFLSYLTHLNLL